MKTLATLAILLAAVSFASATAEPEPGSILATGAMRQPTGPAIQTDFGMRFQDVGSYPTILYDPRAPGPANIVFDKFMDSADRKDYCGDSLVIVGPMPSSDPNTRWEAKMWWRLARRAPLQSDVAMGFQTRYKVWRDRVADGLAIDRPFRPEFTWGWMDSAQLGSSPYRHKFLSNFREQDDDFVGEGNPENEMIWDDVLFPGTKIEYFFTANYVNQPDELAYHPDTTGGFFFEFEVLPGLRTAYVPNCYVPGFNFCVFQPATLYIDADNRGAQFYIENALATVLHGSPPCQDEDGCPLPFFPHWDRYDYLDASSNWNAPFARGAIVGSNNGMTLNQILGYRTILLSTGNHGPGTTEDWDYALYRWWLTTPDSGANEYRQAFVMNGNFAGQILNEFPTYGRPFMQEVLGAGFTGTYAADECFRWAPGISEVIPGTTFSILSPTAGTGSRYYAALDGSPDLYWGQIRNSWTATDGNYRTVLDGVSWSCLALPAEDHCRTDPPAIFAAAAGEIGDALRWAFGVPTNDQIPRLTETEDLAIDQGTWPYPADAAGESEVPIDRLWGTEPNPASGRTTIRFSLAAPKHVEIRIFDVGGRLVRTLVDGPMEQGGHTAAWDGKSDAGKSVGAGVYWASMRSGAFSSTRKLVILN
ncbi:MAG: T9SS type A sorting domain-containing protein [Candidatus Eisenbacteria bacterium]|nr:T9SS type A sorting domain-containing protein [Candidatus Eisenbacteria bacterium]